mmetsp:Transcript_8696/g.21062  ORF Transcript_8696/g.21062 Transcript_8696/m.21062 type:complete len:173 (-) Transcript_8696:1304-1822(-)
MTEAETRLNSTKFTQMMQTRDTGQAQGLPSRLFSSSRRVWRTMALQWQRVATCSAVTMERGTVPNKSPTVSSWTMRSSLPISTQKKMPNRNARKTKSTMDQNKSLPETRKARSIRHIREKAGMARMARAIFKSRRRRRMEKFRMKSEETPAGSRIHMTTTPVKTTSDTSQKL